MTGFEIPHDALCKTSTTIISDKKFVYNTNSLGWVDLKTYGDYAKIKEVGVLNNIAG